MKFLEKFFEHLYLSGLSTLAAVIIGVPTGIVAAKWPRLKKFVMGGVNILQTIPSIAMLGFLIPFFGIGVKPALITLAIYALLPIVRNTSIGIENVPPELIEAADGIGFTPLQKLNMVELPLSLPVMIAGIRTAAVMSVGIATVAAFIGAGGLGDFIYQGIFTNNTNLVLLGAIPAAGLALVMDVLFGVLEKRIAQRKPKKTSKIKIALILTAGVIGISLVLFNPSTEKNKIVVGSKSFTEQYLLGEMISQILEAKTSLKVVKKLNLGSTDICHQALVQGDIDIYPEYTGTAYLTVLKEKNVKNLNPEELLHYVDQYYQEHFQVKWLVPLGFNNTQALAVKESFAMENHLAKISDLIPIQDSLKMGAPQDFHVRPDGYVGLRKTYGLNFGNALQINPVLAYQALEEDLVNVIVAFSTDGRLEAYRLRILEDNKNLFPSYHAAILVRQEILNKFPEVEQSLQLLHHVIDDETMRQLNYQVDIEKKDPSAVARAFLEKSNIQ